MIYYAFSKFGIIFWKRKQEKRKRKNNFATGSLHFFEINPHYKGTIHVSHKFADRPFSFVEWQLRTRLPHPRRRKWERRHGGGPLPSRGFFAEHFPWSITPVEDMTRSRLERRRRSTAGR
jgi:hypothetical protein